VWILWENSLLAEEGTVGNVLVYWLRVSNCLLIIYFINHKLILHVNPTSKRTTYLIYDSNFDRKMKDNTRKCVFGHTPEQSLLLFLYGY